MNKNTAKTQISNGEAKGRLSRIFQGGKELAPRWPQPATAPQALQKHFEAAL
jgi:hypothetical protein